MLYSLGNPADSVAYFVVAKTGPPDFSLGTDFVKYITYFLASPLNLSYLSCFLVFNVIGSIGYIGFDNIIRDLKLSKNRITGYLVDLIIFLPSISFWSSAIGKDAIAFTASILALKASLNLASRWSLAVCALVLMLLVRPHMAALLLISLLVGVLSSNRLTLLQRGGLSLLAGTASISLIPLAIQYSGLAESISAESLSDYANKRQGYNQDGGAGVDISSLPLPLQLGTYLFRPFFFDANSILALVASVENLVLACLFLAAVVRLLKGQRHVAGTPTLFLLSYTLASWLMLSVTTSNLGIALRQKWMFLPFLIYLAIALAPKRIGSASSLQA